MFNLPVAIKRFVNRNTQVETRAVVIHLREEFGFNGKPWEVLEVLDHLHNDGYISRVFNNAGIQQWAPHI